MNETGIDVALRLGFHRMTARDMGQVCKTMLDKRPTREFAKLKPGGRYYYRQRHSDVSHCLVVGKVTPKGTQAEVSVDRQSPRRIYKGDWSGVFTELNDDLWLLSDVRHEAVVKAAIDAWVYVPSLVRREYPDLFIEVPDRFAQDNITAVQRVKNAFSPTWVKREEAVTLKTLDAQIEETHKQIARLQDTRVQAVVVNPDTGVDYDRYIEGHRRDIDFYRWLRRTVDTGGVFNLGAKPL